MLENLRISLQGVWSHKLRSLLTMLGIIIGIAAIIAIVSTIQGTRDQIRNNLIGAGTVDVRLKIGTTDFSQNVAYSDTDIGTYARNYGVPVLGEKDRKEVEKLDHVVDASLYLERTLNMEWGGTGTATDFYEKEHLNSDHLLGEDNHYLNVTNYVVAEGRAFDASDFTHFRKVCMIDFNTAAQLFKKVDPIGKSISIGGEPFTVIGVYTPAREDTTVINSPEDYAKYHTTQILAEVMVPYSCWQMLIGFDEPQNVLIRPDAPENISDVANNASKLLTDKIKPPRRNRADSDMDSMGLGDDGGVNRAVYTASDANEIAKQDEEMQQSTQNMLIWIASISLLVGGIGVMNIMLVSVTERTREIGLKKAIGARKGTIMMQFLTEAAVLTSLGGILGILAGIATAEVIQRVNNIPISISVPWIIIALGFSTLIGVVFGFLPAMQAANLDPIVALRHE